MQTELLIALIGGFGAMLGWGFADFFAKKTIDKVGSFVSLVWAHLFGTVALCLVALFQVFVFKNPLTIPNDLGIWGLLLFFGTLQAIVYLLAYEGFGKGKLSILNPIFASYSGLAALLSIVVFGEVIGLPLLLSLGVIFGGILLLNIDTEAFKLKRLSLVSTPGLKEILSAALLASFWTVFWDKFVGGQDWVAYALFMYAFMTLAAFVIAKAKKVNLSVNKVGLWKFLVLIGVCEVIAYLALSLGFSATSFTSVVAVLSGAFSLPTILLARIFLKEKVTRTQTIGSLVIITGIIVLAMN